MLPWVNRAVFVDDTLFLWSAKRILSTPADFYGGTANWGGTTDRFVDVVMNPPLVSYYLAAIAGVVGFREVPLHVAMMVPAVATILGTYELARRVSHRPLLAAAALLCSPVFLLCSITLMCDITMLALWVWSLALWLRGFDRDEYWSMALGSLLIGFCGLAKYFGIALLPLVLLYGCARQRRLGLWALWLLIPIGMLAVFEWHSHRMYDRFLIWDAANFATIATTEQQSAWWNRAHFALVYAGAGVASLAFWTPWLWNWRTTLGFAIGTVLLGAILIGIGTYGSESLKSPDGVQWNLVIHLTVFAAIGIQALLLMLNDLVRRRDAESLLLSAWIAGTFVFVAWLNWTINGRTVLPLAPVVALLIARKLDARNTEPSLLTWPNWRPLTSLGLGLALSLLLCWSDCRTAATEKESALKLAATYVSPTGKHTLWFEGHWGFQYYLDEQGAYCIDYHGSVIEPQDVVVVQNDNPAVNLIPSTWQFIGVLDAPVPSWLSTNSMDAGASFYSHVMGPLPYRFGKVPARRYAVLRTPDRYEFTPQTPTS
ncbi:MAG: glycosyltransferase family 39 protein [Planctomycetaceae bacterium]|nr:glycosyltransferase family 39 protein [Planctomycetaceae bacterium]